MAVCPLTLTPELSFFIKWMGQYGLFGYNIPNFSERKGQQCHLQMVSMTRDLFSEAVHVHHSSGSHRLPPCADLRKSLGDLSVLLLQGLCSCRQRVIFMSVFSIIIIRN